VDDAMFIRHIIGELLRRHGHLVVGEASNGAEAVAMWRDLRPDLTTLDITMPEVDGIAALRLILEEDPSARIIMCSALKDRPKVMEALQAGARDYVLKPVRAERVIEAVTKAMT
jgi:two-component system chemotaxis response regulator CheY